VLCVCVCVYSEKNGDVINFIMHTNRILAYNCYNSLNRIPYIVLFCVIKMLGRGRRFLGLCSMVQFRAKSSLNESMPVVGIVGLCEDRNGSFLRGPAAAPKLIREAFWSESTNG
jgi:hypothetical protein